MKQKLLSIFLVCLMFASASLAQDKRITGKVTAREDGLPLPGVSVKVSGTQIGTQTDVNGNYSLNVPATGKSLEFSFIGFTTQTVSIGTKTVINGSLDTDAKALSEVIVTGYGTEKKREVTGSIVSIKGDQFENQPLQTFDKALQGRAAGIQVNSNSGQPGGGISVNIRGKATINGSTQPLYIIDGVQLNTGGISGQTSVNALSSINPNDIQSIEILKDAASAAIYGSLAGNGVVIITTKRGLNGKTQIKASSQFGSTEQYNPYKVLSASDWFGLRKEAFENYNVRIGNPASVGTQQAINSAFPSGVLPSEIINYNWYDALIRKGNIKQYDISLNGGDAKTKFFVSGGFSKTDGTIVNSNYNRGTIRGNLDHQVNSKLSIQTSLSLTGSKSLGPGTNQGFFTNTPFTAAYLTAPVNPIYNADGSFNDVLVGTNSQNEVRNLYEETRVAETFQTVSNINLNYKILPSLSVKGYAGIDFSDVRDLNYRPATLSAARAAVGSGNETYRRNINWNTSGTINYAKTFNKDHNFSSLAGFEYRAVTGQLLSASSQGFPSPLLILVSSGSTPTVATSNFTGYKNAGLLGQAKYDYKGKYLLTGNLRYDGSSRFGTNSKFGLFYGVSAGWRISEENFLKSIPQISDLKVRASYGETGVQPLSNFGSLSLYGGGGQYGSPSLSGGLRPIQLPNPDLSWERSKQIDLGFDLGLFSNRITLAFDIYRKTNSDLILDRTLPGDSGFTSISENAGETRSEGIDIDLNTVNIDKNGLKWTTNFNIGFNRNKLLKLINGLNNIQDFTYTVGKPLDQIYTFKYAGVNPADGRQFFYDVNGNLTYNPIASRDRYFVGDQNPSFFGGLSNNLSFKGLSLDFLFQYQYGNESYLQILQFTEQSGSYANNQVVSSLNRWTTPGQLTSLPRPYSQGNGTEPGGIAGNSLSSRYVETASYIRLKQVSLDYRVPQKFSEKFKIPNLTLSLQGLNLLTFTNYRGDDPENSGNNLNFYPNPRTFTAGLNVQF